MSENLSVCLAGDPPVGGAPRGASCPAHMDFPASLLLVDFGQFRSQAQAKPDRGETNAMELMNGDMTLPRRPGGTNVHDLVPVYDVILEGRVDLPCEHMSVQSTQVELRPYYGKTRKARW